MIRKLNKLTQRLGFIIILGSWTGVRTNDQSKHKLTSQF